MQVRHVPIIEPNSLQKVMQSVEQSTPHAHMITLWYSVSEPVQ